MVFRRRDKRPMWRAVLEFVWPRGGYARAAQYLRHRVRRLPDTPEKISRGIWAGVFTSFTPFYTLHFVVAALIAKLMRGNILASIIGTFFGNPLTYLPIAWSSLATGHWLLGSRLDRRLLDAPKGYDHCGIGCQFANAFSDLGRNFQALFTEDDMDWAGLSAFFHEVFYPYLVGCVIPGIICATIAYYLSVPVIRAYQNRRKKRLREKLAQLKNPADGG